METLDAITQAILTYGPSVVSIVSMIATIIIAIKKISSTTKSSLDEVKEIQKSNSILKEDMSTLLIENAELKAELTNCLNRINNIAEVQKGEKR